MATRKPPVVELTAVINGANQLVLMFRDVTKKLVSIRPGTGLEDLLELHGKAASLVIEASDFYQFGTLYDLHGATLADDGHTVAAHWEATGRGRRYRFARAASDRAGTVRFVVGATPRLPGAPVPAPFRSWSDGSGDGGGAMPTDVDPPIGKGKRHRVAR